MASWPLIFHRKIPQLNYKKISAYFLQTDQVKGATVHDPLGNAYVSTDAEKERIYYEFINSNSYHDDR